MRKAITLIIRIAALVAALVLVTSKAIASFR